MIITHQLPPGHLLNELELMRQLHVGRTPLREAIQRLAGDRLVTIVPRRGTVVKAVSAQDARLIFEVRAELEALAARRAAERASAEDIRAMEEALREAEGATDPEFNAVFDHRMHQLVACAAHNEYLADALASFYTLSVRWLHFVRFEREPLEIMLDDHRATVAAIRQRDPEAAARAMRFHITPRAERL